MKKLTFVLCVLIFISIAIGCNAKQSGSPPPQKHEYVVLMDGTYDIPWHIEPDNDIHLILNYVELERLESEYSKYQPHQLDLVNSAFKPFTITAYVFKPRQYDIENVSVDQVALAETKIQVCMGCVDFYTRGEVIELEFGTREEAEIYAHDFMEIELRKNKYSVNDIEIGSWPLFVREYLAFYQEGNSFFIVSSWMPEKIDAILNYLGP